MLILTCIFFSYKHALDGLYQVYKHEGAPRLMSGASMASSRAVLVTIGQVRRYNLTLIAPITTAADDKFCDISPNFQQK